MREIAEDTRDISARSRPFSSCVIANARDFRVVTALNFARFYFST